MPRRRIGLRRCPSLAKSSAMKRVLFSVLFLALSTAALAQSRFSERLTPEERTSAGLDQLTPEQIATLEALIKRDQGRGEQVVREKIRTELREEVKAAVKEEVRAEVKAEVKKQTRAEARKEVAEERLAETRILTRIKGRFDGWDGATVFKLENGQVWKQSEPGMFYVAPVDSPAVLVEKVYGGWRLYYTDGGWIRVVRIK